jgi:hypothetical protein
VHRQVEGWTRDWYWVGMKQGKDPCNRPWRRIGLWDVEDPTLSRHSRQSADRFSENWNRAQPREYNWGATWKKK